MTAFRSTTSGAPSRMAELLGSLSMATDLAVGFASENAMRAATVAVALAREVGIGGEELRATYYAALLRYLGCTSDAHEEARFTAGDDRALMPTFATVDRGRLLPVAFHALHSLAKDAPLVERVQAVGRLLSSPGALRSILVARCDQAVALASHFDLGPQVTLALEHLFARFDGSGHPRGLSGDRISPASRVLHVAHAAAMHRQFEGRAATLRMLESRSGVELDPDLTRAFARRAEEYFPVLETTSAWDLFLEAEPRPLRLLAPDRLEEVATAFAQYVDLKSPSRFGHSEGVARLADQGAQLLGVAPEARTTLRVAALLHDLGAVAVPNGIWDKPGPLTWAERERVRLHAYHTERILHVAPLLREVGAIASAHHERLDGSGYHRSAGAAQQSTSARLLAAADVLHALGETRAHRAALPMTERVRIMKEEVAAGRLDAEVVGALLEATGQAQPRLRTAFPQGLTEREVEVLRVLARGLTNKEIGTALGISARTVQVHVAHIFEKTGINTRAAAALFATRHGLLVA